MAKRAFKEMRGASSKAKVIPGTVSSKFIEYKGVIISPPHSPLDGLVSAKFQSALPIALRKYLVDEDKAPFPGGAPALVVDPEILWYHKAGGLKNIMGSNSYAVVLFRFSDEKEVLGKVQLVTKNAASHTHDKDIAKSMAKELAEWFISQRADPAKASPG